MWEKVASAHLKSQAWIPAPWEQWVSKGRDRKLDCLREISYHFPKCCYPVQQTLKVLWCLGSRNVILFQYPSPERFDQHHISLMIMNSPRNLIVRVCLHNKTCRIVIFIAAFFFFFFFFLNIYILFNSSDVRDWRGLTVLPLPLCDQVQSEHRIQVWSPALHSQISRENWHLSLWSQIQKH